MLQKKLGSLAVIAFLSACGGSNPFIDNSDTTDTGTGTGTTDGTPITSDRTVPPGTASPTPAAGIFRREPTSDEDNRFGDGAAQSIVYDSGTDSFTITGLAFDGNNTYTRSTAVSSLGPYAVYEAASQYPDAVTSSPINQMTHRAVYGVSTGGDVEFAIVRTGAYIAYGFGGFIYQRNGGVTLPTAGQASYSGPYAGLRGFVGKCGIEYSTADMAIDIDFDAFTAKSGAEQAAVRGRLTNREIYDVNGNNITRDILDALEAEYAGMTYNSLPTVVFEVGPSVMDANGEIVGNVGNSLNTPNGAITFEEGKYYALISGDATQGNASNIVGVLVFETTQDQRFENVTVHETGGFILGRN